MRAILIALLVAGCANKANMQRAEDDGVLLRMDLARVMVQHGQYEAAAPVLQRLIAEAPKGVAPRVLFATVLRQRGLLAQAAGQYREALRLAPKEAAAYAGLGVTYSRMGDHPQALAAHRKAVALAPKSAELWNNLGFALYAAGDTVGAIASLEHALALDPTSPLAFNNLGFAYGKQARYDDALRAFRSAVGESRAYLNLAVVYERAGDDKRAAECRDTARRLESTAQVVPARHQEEP
jgi:Flp pilus assembly protein TadD